MGNIWTQEEIDYIRDNYQQMNDNELSQHLIRHSRVSIETKRKRLGFVKTNRKYTFDDVINEFNKTDYILLSTQNDYLDVATNTLKYICPLHKNKGIQKISLGHLQSGRGCYYCGRERTIKGKRIDQDENIAICKQICEQKGLRFVGVDRVNSILQIDYICPNHFEIGVQRMRKGNMFREKIKGCPYCVEKTKYIHSKGEQKVKDILLKYNINYIQQYKFQDCRDIHVLPFDFYLPDLNYCIEYDGEHHYKPVTYNGISQDLAKMYHERTIKHDEIKNQYCKQNKIKLLRIPYYDFDKIESLIKDFLFLKGENIA